MRPSRAMRLASSPLATALMLATGFCVLSLLGKDPWAAFTVFFIEPFSSLYGVGELLLKATPLMICAVGLALGYRANVWNIGAEGQLTVGAIAGSGVALFHAAALGAWALPLMLLAGIAGGMLWAALPALLRTRFNTSEIFVSLMLVYIAQLFLSYLVHGPWRDPAGQNFPESQAFADNAMLPMLVDGARANWGFALALAFALLALIGGGAAGLAGIVEVAGPIGMLQPVISPGYGFTAIIVAFVGRLHPIGIVFAALLMAALYLGGESAQIELQLPASVSGVFQAVLLFFLLAAELFIHFRLRRVHS